MLFRSDSSFEGLRFFDPQQTAREYEYIKKECDVLVLITHMGNNYDEEFARSEKSSKYDLIIGGHSHEEINEVINGIQIVQSGKNLRNIGATTITMKGNKLGSISYRNVPLNTYDSNQEIASKVAEHYNNPLLKQPIGRLAKTAERAGLRNLFADAIREKSGAEVGFYHNGGVRLEIGRAHV